MGRLRRPAISPSRRSCLELERQYPELFPGRGRPSQVPEIPPYTFAPLADPGRVAPPIAVAVGAMRFPLMRSEKPRRLRDFRDSVTRLRYSLHTLRAVLTERLRNVRFRLVASLCRAGLATRRVSIVSFITLRLHQSRYIGLILSRRISHELTTAAAYTSVLTALCSVGLLDVLYKYVCGGLGRMSCQADVSTASLRNPVRNAG